MPFVTAARGGSQALIFSRLVPVRPVGAYERGCANRRSRGTAGFTVSGYIVEIDALADPARLRQLDLTVLDLRI